MPGRPTQTLRLHPGKCYKSRAISSGCRQSWPLPAGADELAPGRGAAEAGGAEVLAEPEGEPEAEAAGGPDGPASGSAGADGLGEACGGGASCLQAAMTTRLPDGSA